MFFLLWYVLASERGQDVEVHVSPMSMKATSVDASIEHICQTLLRCQKRCCIAACLHFAKQLHVLVKANWPSVQHCILGSVQVLVRECGKSSLNQRRRLPRSTVVDHINHICFWTGAAGTMTLLAFSLSNTVQYPAMLVAAPLLLAMVVQGSIWCAKDRHFACGVAIPEGFPFDPFLLTSLFVAAKSFE